MWKYLISITRLERSVLLYIAAFSMVGFAHIGMNTVLSNLYLLSLGFDTAFIGTLTGVGQMVWALTALPAAVVGARIGLRGSLIIGYGLVALLFIAYINAPLLPRAVWPAWLMVTNTLLWASVSLMSVNGLPYMMAMSPEDQRGRAFTLQSAVMPVMAFLGSLLAGFLPGLLTGLPGLSLSESNAYRAVLIIAALSYFLSMLLVIMARPAPALPKPAPGAVRQAAPLGLLVFLGLLFTVQIASESALMTFMNVYLSKELLVSTGLIGTMFAVVRLLPFFISPVIPLALNRWGSGLTMTAGYVLVAVAGLGMAFLHHWLAAGIAFVLVSLSSSVSGTARGLFNQEAVEPRWRTMSNAVAMISLAAGGGLAGYGGGLLIERSGFASLFLASAGLAVAGMGLYAARRRKKAQPVVAAPVEPEAQV